MFNEVELLVVAEEMLAGIEKKDRETNPLSHPQKKPGRKPLRATHLPRVRIEHDLPDT